MLFIYIAAGIIIFGMTTPLLTAARRSSTLVGFGCLAVAAVISAVIVSLWGVWGILPFAAVAAVMLSRQLQDAVRLYPRSPRQRINIPSA